MALQHTQGEDSLGRGVTGWEEEEGERAMTQPVGQRRGLGFPSSEGTGQGLGCGCLGSVTASTKDAANPFTSTAEPDLRCEGKIEIPAASQ